MTTEITTTEASTGCGCGTVEAPASDCGCAPAAEWSCCCASAEAPTAENAIPEEARTRCEVWTRVMGYHRPVASFNQGKKGEYADRVTFAEPGDVA